jgi:hypothetical protein
MLLSFFLREKEGLCKDCLGRLYYIIICISNLSLRNERISELSCVSGSSRRPVEKDTFPVGNGTYCILCPGLDKATIYSIIAPARKSHDVV